MIRPRPIIHLSREGDLTAERLLIGLARLQHKILRDQMVFNELKQGVRTLRMLDGSCIIVKSCYDIDEVFVYSPPRPYTMLKSEAFRPINFVGIEQDTSTVTRLVHFYDFNGKLIHTVNLNDHLGQPVDAKPLDPYHGTVYKADNRVTFINADGDLDSVFVHAWVNNWRGYSSELTITNDYGYDETFYFNSMATVKIPISVEKDPITKEVLPPELIYDYWPGFMGDGVARPDFSPPGFMQTRGGIFFFTAGIDTEWTGTLGGLFDTARHYVFADSGTFVAGLYTNSADFITNVYFDMSINTHGDYLFYSPYYVLMRKCDCVYSNLHVSAVEVRILNNSYVGDLVQYTVEKYCIGVWPAIVIDELFSTSLISSYNNMTDLLTLTQDQYNHLAQILVHGNKFYLFYDSQTFTSITPYVEAYELNADTLKLDLIQQKTFSRDTIDRVSILRMEITDELIKELGLLEKLGTALEYIDGEWQPRYVACYRLINEWAESDAMYSDMYIMDLETFTELKTVSLPQLPAYAYLEPIPSYAQKRVNEERLKEPGTEMYYLNFDNFPKYTMPMRKVSNDYILQYILGQHLKWCIENGRMSHDGLDGRMPEERGADYGYLNVGEILTLVPMDITDTNELIDAAINAWLESPHHKAVMVHYRHTCMGFATATFPEDTTSITIGAGMHLGGGSYTSGDTVHETGQCRVFGIMFAG